MFEVFNMGCRMEIYCPEEHAEAMIAEASRYAVDARVIGRWKHPIKELLSIITGETIRYE